MQVFPVFLHLQGRSCLVVGGGPVGRDKASRLAAAGAEVTVVEPCPSADLSESASASGVRIEPRAFHSEDCRGQALVFACTGDPVVNAAVLEAAQSFGAPCCRTDAADLGDFSTGASLARGEVCVAVSSGGTSPHLALAAREEIDQVFGEEFGEAASLLGELRTQLKARGDGASQILIESGEGLTRTVLDCLRRGERAEAERAVADVLAKLPKEALCTR